jgi:hypothetical protein
MQGVPWGDVDHKPKCANGLFLELYPASDCRSAVKE